MTFAELLDFTRAVVRPTVTLSGWTVFLVMVATGQTIPDAVFKLIAGLTLWWFGERAVGHLKGGNGGNHTPPGTPPV